jgi:hypothetical protein
MNSVPDQLPELRRWLATREISWICAVSPHLDDAAFSIATFLAEPELPPREVWTVFSATTAYGDVAYARAMGFADPMQEFEARRAEDREAMARLRLPYVHVGAVASSFEAQDAAALITSIREAAQTRLTEGRTLLLLPAGAGAELGTTARLWRRLTRRPMGCRAHAEHERVRDALSGAFGAGVDVGYYAECPYLWSEGVEHLGARLQSHIEPALRALAVKANVNLRLEVARAYRSQFVSEFGQSLSYQRRSLEGPEWLFLPV